MKTRLLIIIGCIGMIVIGIYLNFEYYQSTINPLNLTKNNLDNIVGSSDHVEINAHLLELKQNLILVMDKLPKSKNPVWAFPTESTNFLRIESYVNGMITSIESTSAIPNDSSAYYTGILDIHDRADITRKNIANATGFLYASASNIFFTLIWVCGIAGLDIMRIRK